MAVQREQLLAQLGDIFRQYGFEGASLARIGAATGMGKGSLYHSFPGGKDEMAEAVLAHIDAWFERAVFAPLRSGAAGPMFDAVDAYFQSGQKVCLVGVFALGGERDRFGPAVKTYFVAWIDALEACLARTGRADARALAEEVVEAIQGALVLARALDDPALFGRTLARLRARCL